jgi:ribonuclease HII
MGNALKPLAKLCSLDARGTNKLRSKWLERLREGINVVTITIGIDEAGRGPVFGPMVVAGAANLTGWHLPSIRDSKDIKNENTRRTLAAEIRHNMAWSLSEIPVEAINRFGTLVSLKFAGEQVMNKLIAEVRACLPGVALEVIFDGRDHRERTMECGTKIRCEDKADSKYFCVSAASILAKVHHDDRIHEICRSHSRYQNYDLDSNKGYPTKHHKDALVKFGMTDQHRTTACATFLADKRGDGKAHGTPPAQAQRAAG